MGEHPDTPAGVLHEADPRPTSLSQSFTIESTWFVIRHSTCFIGIANFSARPVFLYEAFRNIQGLDDKADISANVVKDGVPSRKAHERS